MDLLSLSSTLPMTLIQRIFDKVDRFLDHFRSWKGKRYSGTGIYKMRKPTWLKGEVPIRYTSKMMGRATHADPKKIAKEYREKYGEDLFGDE